MTADMQAALEAANRIMHNAYPPGPARFKMFVEDAQLVAGALALMVEEENESGADS